MGEYAHVFGERFVNPSPPAPITDGLDTISGLLDRGDLLIHPRCKHLIAAFQSYARAKSGGQWLDVPAASQSPSEDMLDALRYGIRGTWPNGRRPVIEHRRVHAASLF